jgi:hypothetical protein
MLPAERCIVPSNGPQDYHPDLAPEFEDADRLSLTHDALEAFSLGE